MNDIDAEIRARSAVRNRLALGMRKPVEPAAQEPYRDVNRAITHVAKLHQTELAELGNAGVRGLALEEQLTQSHLLTAEERAHLRGWK